MMTGISVLHGCGGAFGRRLRWEPVGSESRAQRSEGALAAATVARLHGRHREVAQAIAVVDIILGAAVGRRLEVNVDDLGDLVAERVAHAFRKFGTELDAGVRN